MTAASKLAIAGAIALVGGAAAYLWATSGAVIVLGLTYIGCL